MNRIAGIAAASVITLGLGARSPAGALRQEGGDVTGEITYAHWDPNQEETVAAMIEAFNEDYPDVTVTPIVLPYGQYWTTLQTQASSDTLPDVFWMDMPYFPLYAANDQLAPIDELIDSGAIDPSKYPENLTDFYRYDDVQYAVPKDVDTNAMWLNTALFERAGVPLPSEDWTYEEYRETAAAIQGALGDEGIYGTAFYPYGQTTYYSSVFAYGGSILGEDGKGGWAEPGSIRGLKVWVDIVADGSSPTLPQLTETTADQWFLNGKAAMFPSIAGASVALMGSAPDTSAFVAFPLPLGEKRASVGQALANVVSARSANLPAAQAFQAFLAGKEAQLIQSGSGVTLSAYEGTSEAFVDSHADLGLQTFVDAIEYSVAYPAMPAEFWASKEPEIFSMALSGAITVKEAAQQLDDALNEALADN